MDSTPFGDLVSVSLGSFMLYDKLQLTCYVNNVFAFISL